jgi:molecular chaperone Hsp33
MADHLKKYLFEDRRVRVQAVRLHDTWLQAQAHHAYPPAVRRLLGELVAASVLLAANIKFDGSLLLQIQGDGPIALLVVECGADLSLRATVKVREGHVVPEDGTLQSLLNAHGEGRFVVLLDPRRRLPGQQTYQGIVPLEGETVAEALQHYMKASEQLDTRLWLAADADCAAGLLVQRLPEHGGTEGALEPGASFELGAPSDTWNRAVQLTDTLGEPELLATDIDTLIHRLYWEETLVAFEPQQVRWWCPCTRERVADMLRMLGESEVQAILAERSEVEVSCDFCGKPYVFDRVDCAGLFTPGTAMPGQDPPTMH